MDLNGMLVLIALCAFIAGFAVSLGPVMWAMFSEIFPQQYRGIAISVAGFFNSFIAWAVVQAFPMGLASVGPAVVFGFFGALAVGSLLFTVVFVPETKGKSLEEISTVWRRG